MVDETRPARCRRTLVLVISAKEAAERSRILGEQLAAEFKITLPEAQRRVTKAAEVNVPALRALFDAVAAFVYRRR